MDAAQLEALARVLLNRADDVYYLGQQLVSKSESVDWRCAKADRFREAMRGRRSEATQIAEQLRDLGRQLRLEGQRIASGS